MGNTVVCLGMCNEIVCRIKGRKHTTLSYLSVSANNYSLHTLLTIKSNDYHIRLNCCWMRAAPILYKGRRHRKIIFSLQLRHHFNQNLANRTEIFSWSILWFFSFSSAATLHPVKGARPKVLQYQRRLPGTVIMHCASIKRPLWLQGFSDIFLQNSAIFAKALLSGG